MNLGGHFWAVFPDLLEHATFSKPDTNMPPTCHQPPTTGRWPAVPAVPAVAQEDKKMPLLRDEVFVCKYFQLPGAPWGTACDITNMTFQVPEKN